MAGIVLYRRPMLVDSNEKTPLIIGQEYQTRGLSITKRSEGRGGQRGF